MDTRDDAAEKGRGETMNEHYHVVEFINGCLNDYDSGPIDTLDNARCELDHLVNVWNDEEAYVPAGNDRYQRGIYILKVESCTEDCDPDADY
jgi:hypothetical protein